MGTSGDATVGSGWPCLGGRGGAVCDEGPCGGYAGTRGPKHCPLQGVLCGEGLRETWWRDGLQRSGHSPPLLGHCLPEGAFLGVS